MEDYIRLDEAAKLVPGKPAPATLWRWCTVGITIRAADEVVRLRFVRIGRKFFTTADWLDEFIHRATAVTLRALVKDRPRKVSRDRLRQLAEADEILARAGI